LSRVPEPKYLFSEIEEKNITLNLKICHFKASGDVTTNFGSKKGVSYVAMA